MLRDAVSKGHGERSISAGVPEAAHLGVCGARGPVMRAGELEPGRGALQTQGPATCRPETVFLSSRFQHPGRVCRQTGLVLAGRMRKGARERALTFGVGWAHAAGGGGVSTMDRGRGSTQASACPSWARLAVDSMWTAVVGWDGLTRSTVVPWRPPTALGNDGQWEAGQREGLPGELRFRAPQERPPGPAGAQCAFSPGTEWPMTT